MKRFLWPLFLAAICALAFAARCWNLGDVFVAGRIYFLDADCYSRMTRAALVADGHLSVIRHHHFENFPQGVKPHTTAPLDWLIVVGKKWLDGGFWMLDREGTSILRDQTLDLSGALISPVLGALTCAWLGWWARRQCTLGLQPADRPRAVCSWSVPLLFAISPVLVHGTVLGRPDHQSFLLLVLAIAFSAEWCLIGALQGAGAARPDAGPRGGPPLLLGWSVIAGVAWALALWVSLYEPFVMLAAVLGLWLIGDRRRFTARGCRAGWVAFGGVLLVAALLDGGRVVWPDVATRAAFASWQTTIGELRHLDLRTPTLLRWLGAACVLTPVLLGMAARRGMANGKSPMAIPALLLVLLALTLWQLRWGYFLALLYAMSLPWQLAALRRPWIAAAAFGLGLWPVAQEWETTLFPDRTAQQARAERRAEGVHLRAVAERMRAGGERAGFLAPWWLSPALAYWSGQPGVAGSSHEALAGTMQTARFYLAANAADAEAIARRLGVRWIITDGSDEDGRSRLVKAYGPLLAGATPEAPWGVTMHERGQPREQVSAEDLRAAAPELRARLLALTERAETDALGSAAFTCVFKNQFFKLFRVKESGATGTP